MTRHFLALIVALHEWFSIKSFFNSSPGNIPFSTSQFQMTSSYKQTIPSQAKRKSVSWMHAWACLCSRKFSAAPLGVTDMLLKSQFAAAMLDIDDGSVCLPSILLPICQTYSPSWSKISHAAATFGLPLDFGEKWMWWIPHTNTHAHTRTHSGRVSGLSLCILLSNSS